MRRVAQALAEDRSRADSIASALYQLALANELPDEGLRAVAWWAWDALDLADQGLIQDVTGRRRDARGPERSRVAQTPIGEALRLR